MLFSFFNLYFLHSRKVWYDLRMPSDVSTNQIPSFPLWGSDRLFYFRRDSPVLASPQRPNPSSQQFPWFLKIWQESMRPELFPNRCHLLDHPVDHTGHQGSNLFSKLTYLSKCWVKTTFIVYGESIHADCLTCPSALWFYQNPFIFYLSYHNLITISPQF